MTVSDPVDTPVSGPGPVPARTEEPTIGATPEQLEAEIEVQRAQLADTVDQLTQKLDVKAQAKARVSRIPTTTYAAFAGAALLVGGLLWWRGRR
jgi:hypothetical protein